MTANDFKNYILENSDLWKNTEDKSIITILLISCETGKGINSIAKQISELFPDAIIIAPTENIIVFGQGNGVTIGGSGKQGVKKVNDLKNRKWMGKWRCFKNGKILNTSKNGFIYSVNKLIEDIKSKKIDEEK